MQIENSDEKQLPKKVLNKSMDKNLKEEELNKVQKLDPTWSKRQKELEVSENRLLFGFSKKIEYEKWLYILSMFVGIINYEFEASANNK